MQEKLRSELKDAMRAKDETRLNTIRGILSAVTNELVAKGRTPQDTLTDEEIMGVIAKLVKQRRDSITQFENLGRSELAAQEKIELAILESYLPAQMSDEELTSVIKAKVSELGISSKSDIGKLMGALSKDLKGKADGGRIKTMAESLLN